LNDGHLTYHPHTLGVPEPRLIRPYAIIPSEKEYFRWGDAPAPDEIEMDEGFSLEDLLPELGRLEFKALGYVKHIDIPHAGKARGLEEDGSAAGRAALRRGACAVR
jgi:hypothetical protein